jgi:hypothetical protein
MRTFHWMPSTRTILIVFFSFSVIRLITYVVQFGQFSLQMDFSSFYTAGESLNRQLSPYQNLVTDNPPIWDGAARYSYSRFLYPPLAASFFRLWAFIPYSYAKYLWMIFSLACMGVAILAAQSFTLEPSKPGALWVIAIFTSWYYPLLPLLERGQIDALTLLLIILGLRWMIGKQHEFLAGFLFAAASLFKLHTLLLIPFLVLRKRWKAVQGCLLGVLITVALTFLFNGIGPTLDYAFTELPRISQYGGGGEAAMKLPTKTFTQILQGVPKGLTQKDGRVYSLGEIEFTSHATLAKTPATVILKWAFYILGLKANITLFSATFYALFFSLLLGWEIWYKFQPPHWKITDETGYWLMVLVIILLCAPLTWVMNTIWLIPIAGLLITYQAEQKNVAKQNLTALFLFGLAFGLLLIAIPDQANFPPLPYWISEFLFYKYAIGELFIFVGLFAMLARKRRWFAQRQETP